MSNDEQRYAEGVNKDWMREGASYLGGVEMVSGVGAVKELPMQLMARRAAIKKAAQWELPGPLAADAPPAPSANLDDLLSGSEWSPGPTKKRGPAYDDDSTFTMQAESPTLVPKDEWRPPKDNTPSDTEAITKTRQPAWADDDAPEDYRVVDRDLARLHGKGDAVEKMSREAEEAYEWEKYAPDNTSARRMDAADWEAHVSKKLSSIVPAPILAAIPEEDRKEIYSALRDAMDLGAESASDLVDFLGKTRSGILLKPLASKLMEALSTPEGQLTAAAAATPAAMAAAPLATALGATAGIPVLGARMMSRLAEDDPQKKVYNSLESNARISGAPLGPKQIDSKAMNMLVETYLTDDFEEAYSRGIISDELFEKVTAMVEAKGAPAAPAPSGGGKVAKAEAFKGRGGWGYEVLPDGNVRITSAPSDYADRVGLTVKKGQRGHDAIMAEYRERAKSNA